MGFILKLIVNAVAVFITAKLLSPNVMVPDLYTALIVALVLGLLNTFIKPVIKIFTLPLTIMTLGLFSFVINALIIMGADYLIAGFTVVSFWWALLFSLVLSIISFILNRLVR